MSLHRRDASRALNRIARLLELQGDNPHRIRAFANASRAIAAVDGDLGAMVASGEILAIRGIGRGTAEVLASLARGERPQVLQRLLEEIPAEVEEMLELQGLGPKKVRSIWRTLGVESLGELLYACHENRLLDLPGFGPTVQLRVMEALELHLSARDRLLVHDAALAACRARELLAALPAVVEMREVGELRRGAETVSRVELLVVCHDLELTTAALHTLAGAVQSGREPHWQLPLEDGPQLVIHLAERSSAAASLVLSTGSPEHLDNLAARLGARGLKLRWDGLFHAGEGRASAREEDIYEAAGCTPVAPELREGEDELELASGAGLPPLVEAADIHGALHNHTTDSDGESSLEEMATAASALGWSFFGVADHSPVAVYANGVDAARLAAQGRRADAISAAATPPIQVFKGIEADILRDGSLDLPQGAASHLDYVVASVHSGFRLSTDEQTARVLTAVAHPSCRVLGHPTGRLLLAREGYQLDLEAVLDSCAAHRVAVEINASPYRLDLGWRWARRALAKGVQLIVNPDAHSIAGLEDLRWGLMIARKAGAARNDLLNTMGAEELRAWLRR